MCWYLTYNLEWDVRRIRLNRIKAERQGKLYVEDDVKVYEERQVYTKTLGKGRDAGVAALHTKSQGARLGLRTARFTSVRRDEILSSI